jgi:hypothetical protein
MTGHTHLVTPPEVGDRARFSLPADGPRATPTPWRGDGCAACDQRPDTRDGML